MKYLIWLILLGIIWWVLTGRGKRSQASAPVSRKDLPAEQMVVCAHCGVHLPQSEALASGGQMYCSDAHLNAATGAQR